MISSRTRKNATKCPTCNQSRGEEKIHKFLKSNNFNFIEQYKINGLKGINNGLLKFDFAIFDDSDNLSYIIEYDGEFHFGKVYENDNHEIIQIHDQRKNDYCEQHNIKIIRIPYWYFDRVEEILEKELSILKHKLFNRC